MRRSAKEVEEAERKLSRAVADELRSIRANSKLAQRQAERREQLQSMKALMGLAVVQDELATRREQAEASSGDDPIPADVAYDILDRITNDWPQGRERLALRYGLGIGHAGSLTARMADATKFAEDNGDPAVGSTTLLNLINGRAGGDLLGRFADALISAGKTRRGPAGAAVATAAADDPSHPRWLDPALAIAVASVIVGLGLAAIYDKSPVVAVVAAMALGVVFVAYCNQRRLRVLVSCALALPLGLVAFHDDVLDDAGETAAQETTVPESEPDRGAVDDEQTEPQDSDPPDTTEASDASEDSAPETDSTEPPAAVGPADSTTPETTTTTSTSTTTSTTTSTIPEPVVVPLWRLDPFDGGYFEDVGQFFHSARQWRNLKGDLETREILIASVGANARAEVIELSWNLRQEYESISLQFIYSPTSADDGAVLVKVGTNLDPGAFEHTYVKFDPIEPPIELSLTGVDQITVTVRNVPDALCQTDPDIGCELWFTMADLVQSG